MKKIPFRDYHILNILKLYDEEKAPLDLLFNRYFRENKALGSKDKKEISETLYGMIRWLSIIDTLCKSPITWEKRLEAYRLEAFETQKNNPALSDWVRVSFPKALFEKLKNSLGREETLSFCLASNTRAPATIRVNPAKTTQNALFEKWKNDYDIAKTPRSPYGIIFKRRINYFQLPEFKQGLFEVQDEGSQLLADLVAAVPKEQILDFCAGSGGKTLAFAHKLQGSGQIFLHDVRPQALKEAAKRLARAGIQNYQTAPANDPKLMLLAKKMDWVLVDAPCSGTGTLRRNPDMKWRFCPEEFEKLLLLQRQIFENALEFVRPGGKIIWATCSVLQEENEAQAAHFLERFPLEASAEPLKILPEQGGPDGFFAQVFTFKP